MSGPHPTSREAEVLRANQSFYQAFTAGDFTAMSQLWAKHTPLICVHPGAPALFGREPVLESWRQILREPPPLEMRCDHARAQLIGELAIVTCYEGNGAHPAHLAATNVFTREDGAWRLVHHHAGPLSTPIPASPSSDRLN